LSPGMFQDNYRSVFEGDDAWKKLPAETGTLFPWDPASSYIVRPPYFDDDFTRAATSGDIIGARILAILGDTVTTDHISPVSRIRTNTPAGDYLQQQGVDPRDFNS